MIWDPVPILALSSPPRDLDYCLHARGVCGLGIVGLGKGRVLGFRGLGFRGVGTEKLTWPDPTLLTP